MEKILITGENILRKEQTRRIFCKNLQYYEQYTFQLTVEFL